MPTYTCEKCARVFKQKSGFDDHVAKKKDCSSQTSIPAIIAKVKEEVKATIRNAAGDEELILPEDQIQRDKVLQTYFEEIHNILWSRAGFEPAKAMEHLTFFFAYRLIELQADKLGLPAECRWSYLASQKNEQDMFEIIKKGYASFAKNPITKPFFKQPEIKKAEIVYDIVKQINKIPSAAIHDTDTLGNIFEYAQSWGTSTMSSEGQFFTNRKICKLAFKLAYQVKGSLRREDGTLCTFADWFCGTGGFPAEYVKGVNENLPDVNWEKDKESIHCQDQSVSACMTTLLNMLIMTGTPFSDKKIRQGNSFGDSVITGQYAPFADTKIDYIFLNPPYGGSKFEYSKKVKAEDGSSSIRYFVNQDIQSIGIADDDKVSAGVQLAMATLSTDGGVCAIVLPQGFFFGSTKKVIELRKKIAEEYKIHYVVDIASGSFLNTGTKTSMMIFQRGVGPTERVKFIGMDEKELVETTLESLRAKNYSLNYKQYLAQEAVEVEGFEMVKLDDLVTITTGKNKTPDDKKGIMYPYYGTSGVTGYTDHFLEDGEYILTARNGTIGNTFLIKGKTYPSDHMFTVRTNEKCQLKYLYYWMISNKQVLVNLANTTTIPGITRANLVDIQIPLPSLERQQQIVEAIDGWTVLAQQEEQALKTLEKQVMFQVKEMGRGKERVKLETIAKDITFGFMVSSSDYGSSGVPVIKTKNIKSKEVLYPASDQKITTKLDERYKVRRGDLLVVLGGSPGENGIWEFDEEAWLNQDCAKISIENTVTKEYVFYSLQGQAYNDYIEANTTKTTIGHISRGVVREIEIPLPPLAEQEKLQSDYDEIRHKHAKIAAYRAKAQEAIQRLIPGAAPATPVLTKPPIESVQQEKPKEKRVIKIKKSTPAP